MLFRYLLIILVILSCACPCFAREEIDAVYPYSLDKKTGDTVYRGSTVPLYLNIKSYDVPHDRRVKVTVTLPEGFTASADNGWQVDGSSVTGLWTLPADYGQTFGLLYIRPLAGAAAGRRSLQIDVRGDGLDWHKEINFSYGMENPDGSAAPASREKPDGSKFNWYIQGLTLPVDSQGNKDDRTADNVLYVRDTALEGFRSRITGDGAASWAAVFNHPAAWLLLDMRNPQQDVRVLKFKAELLDRKTGRIMPGLCTAGKNDEDSEHGWAGSSGVENATTAMISLDGKKMQAFIIPLYIDYFRVIEGDYTMRITVSGNGQQKIQEVPVTITQKNNIGLAAVGAAFLCLAAVLLSLPRMKRCIAGIGAKGAITVALFAAIAFGGITVPTSILGELLHVFLGPFSGFISGILSGVLQYLLIVALAVLYRRPGTVALMFMVKFMLSGLLFGNFTPLSLLSCCVYITVLELSLRLCGFFRRGSLTAGYMLAVAMLLGLADAVITFINMEQMMFFYRLYYADWYLALYMLINGFIYSSFGSWLGYKTGCRLQLVTGE